MAKPVTEAEFAGLLARFEHTAFRWEAQAAYQIGIERAAYEAFLAGRPRPPAEVGWWRDWLSQVQRQVREQGKTIRRVRVIDEPPTDYQRFEMWTVPWHVRVGEQIAYLPRRRARALGLPLYDWWLLDDRRLVITRFSPEGTIISQELDTSPGALSAHRALQHLATSNATAAEPATA